MAIVRSSRWDSFVRARASRRDGDLDGEDAVRSGLVATSLIQRREVDAGGREAGRAVLRRHRLVELFLVRVMGMSWAEVHDEAEQLEHAVSDRLIQRIDEMLGRPAVDPHGDPIPDHGRVIHSAGLRLAADVSDRSTAVVCRVVDQDADFLRFIEQSDLKPGQPDRRRSAQCRRRSRDRPRRRPFRRARHARSVEADGRSASDAQSRGQPI